MTKEERKEQEKARRSAGRQKQAQRLLEDSQSVAIVLSHTQHTRPGRPPARSGTSILARESWPCDLLFWTRSRRRRTACFSSRRRRPRAARIRARRNGTNTILRSPRSSLASARVTCSSSAPPPTRISARATRQHWKQPRDKHATRLLSNELRHANNTTMRRSLPVPHLRSHHHHHRSKPLRKSLVGSCRLHRLHKRAALDRSESITSARQGVGYSSSSTPTM